MTPELFETLLETYGADLSRWPMEHQSAAGHFLRSSAAARQSVERMAELDRLILQAAPDIAARREDRAIDAVLNAVRQMPVQAPSWFIWNWGTGGLTYAGLFVLGSASNLLIRFFSQESPLDALFSSNLLSSFGG
ncbi:MAG TPA: hypothetical protein VM661_04515 [Candidatus Sulfotelmatobacter sp.]|jgi:hypothetical protein|nr:hypothetical protein [Candidatus Sulfotelmatobacter sp.]